MKTITRSNRLDNLVGLIIEAGGMHIRDVDGGEEPFLYSSGNKGPGYVSIKGLVSRTRLRDALIANLAHVVAEGASGIDFVAANATGGMVPGTLLHQELSRILGRDIKLVYVRDTRKLGGLKEHVTGVEGLEEGSLGLVVEELVNYATTTTNSAVLLRSLGFVVDHAATVVSYDTPPSRRLLQEHKLSLHSLFTMADLLGVAEERRYFNEKAVASYREFLSDPDAWMAKRGLVREERGGTK